MQSAGLHSLNDTLARSDVIRPGVSSAAYHNIHQLKNIDGGNQQLALDEIGRQFESLLVHQMLKSMRNASKVWSEDSLFNSDRVDFYQQMLDDQLSLELVKGDGLGLAQEFSRRLGHQFDRPESGEPGQEVTQPPVQATDQWRRELVTAPSVNTFAEIAQGESVDAEKPFSTAANQDSEFSVAPLPARFSSAEEFIDLLNPLAKAAAERLGVPAETILAQAALETGWGKNVIEHADGRSSYNLFGIKADSRWQGESAQVSTLEYFADKPVRVNAEFRSYGSFAESFDDYVTFILGNSRYSGVVQNPAQYPQALQQAGYATDPAYAEKIQGIVQRIQHKDTRGDAETASNAVIDNSVTLDVKS